MLEKKNTSSPILAELLPRLEGAKQHVAERRRPFVTLAYAQSLDGSIAGEGNRRLKLSCQSSLRLTHELRAAHDAILVGIGTVIADDPRLNVRLVSGCDPLPIVVDSRLRFPGEARLLHGERETWVATTEACDPARRAELETRGVSVVRLPSDPDGGVDLAALLAHLAAKNLAHVLVEGGARVLTSFIRARLVDYLVLTVSPQFVGGTPALSRNELSPFPRLRAWRSERLGDDLLMAGELSWSPE